MSNQVEFYHNLLAQTNALIDNEPDIIANMANISALLFEQLPDVNWVGFYRVVGNELVLGPFQGKVACIRIPRGRGVCGTCLSTEKVQRISDVHQFDGHIACDASSNAELVIPVKIGNEVIAVLDIDSTQFGRFEDHDEQGLSAIVKAFEKNITVNNND